MKLTYLLLLLFCIDTTAIADHYYAKSGASGTYAYPLWLCAGWCGFEALRTIKRFQLNREYDIRSVKKPLFNRTALSYMKRTLDSYERNPVMRLKRLQQISDNAEQIKKNYTDFGKTQTLPERKALKKFAYHTKQLNATIHGMRKDDEKSGMGHFNAIRSAITCLQDHVREHACFQKDTMIKNGTLLLFYICNKLPRYCQDIQELCAFERQNILEKCGSKMQDIQKKQDALLDVVDQLSDSIQNHESTLKQQKKLFELKQQSIWTPKALKYTAASLVCAVGGAWAWWQGK